MTQTKHTPGEAVFFKAIDKAFPECTGHFCISGNAEEAVALFSGYEEAEADAMEMVHRWNCHEELLKTAETLCGFLWLLVDMADQPGYLQEKRDKVRQQVDAARALIAKATGQQAEREAA